MIRSALAPVVVVLLLLTATPADAQFGGTANCSRVGQNTYVRDVMRDLYYWYRFLPNANPASYASPEAFLEAVRYRTLDSSFSYITSKESNDAFYGDSAYVGFGFSTRVTDTEMRVLQVFPESPASEAGFSRGDRIIEVNGRRVSELIASGAIGSVFGPAEEGFSAEIVRSTKAGEEKRVQIVKRVVTIPTVSLTRVFETDGRTVGYFHFRNFVRPSYNALDAAFESLKAAGATDLVLDVRYNGGGMVDVAVHLASLIGGSVTNGQVFAEYQHNDRNTRYNETLRFRNPEKALRLERLFVITTRSSASASELVINSLRPHLPVVVIGDRTYGKPVGQYALNFCDKVLAPVAFKLVNANGEGDFFDGIPADCSAADDAEHDLGSADEGSLAEALHYIRTGSCSAPPSETETVRVVRSRVPPRREVGWQSVVNAH